MPLRQMQIGFVSVCVLSLSVEVDAWSCKVTVIGSTELQQSVPFSTAEVHCTPGVDEQGQNLTVVVDSTLSSANFTGKYARAALALTLMPCVHWHL